MYSHTDIIESDIIFRFLEGDLSEQETIGLKQWLDVSDENRHFFQQIEKLWNETQIVSIADDEKYKTNESWNEIDETISTKNNFAIRFIYTKLAVAASFLLLIGLGFYFWNSKSNNSIVTVATTNTMQMVKLPDSSTVWLNRNSKLTYKKNFNTHRELQLSGEAFFEVQANPENPFEINTLQTKITVVGTKFNVNAYPNDTTTEVKVLEGKVRFASNENKTEIVLVAGERGVNTSKNEVVKTKSDNDTTFLFWKTRELIFNNTNIVEVANILQKIYHVKIKLEIENAKNCKISGNYDNPTLNDILEILQVTLGIVSETKGDTIFLKSKGC